MQKAAPKRTVRVWDLPVRLFHWILVALIVFSYVTAQIGKIEWHMLSGKAILSLVLFRLIWGVVGSETARFRSFLKGPAETFGYAAALVRGAARRYLGHNPMGGWSAAAMLLLILVQAGSGMFATDDIYTDGPLKYLVSDAASKRLTTIHRYAVDVLIVLVVMHVAAVLFYLIVKKDNLVAAMVTGDKPAEGAPPPTGAAPAPWLAPALLAFAFAVVFGALAIFGR